MGKLGHIVLDFLSGTEKMKFHAPSGVTDASSEIQGIREVFAKGTKPHALNDAENPVMSVIHDDSSPYRKHCMKVLQGAIICFSLQKEQLLEKSREFFGNIYGMLPLKE